MAHSVLDPVAASASPAASTSEGPDSLPYNEEQLSLWTLGTMVLRKRKLAGIVSLSIFALGMFVVVATTNNEESWTATTTFMPDEAASSSSSSLAEELASRLGLSRESGVHVYSDLMNSRALLGMVAETRFRFVRDGETVEGTIAEVAGFGDEDPDKARLDAINWLRERITVEVNTLTNVVTVYVSAPQPQLARDIAERLVEVLQEYNISMRQNSASEERKFVEGRLAALRAELETAEAALAKFLRENRRYESSPDLRIAYDRLRRDVEMKQQIVTYLAQSYEQARIVEVRNTPVITIIDSPEVPLVPDRKSGLVIRVMAVLVVAMAFGVAAGLVSGFLERTRAAPPAQYREFEAEWSATRSDLGKLFRGVGARLGRDRAGS